MKDDTVERIGFLIGICVFGSFAVLCFVGFLWVLCLVLSMFTL